MTKNIEKMNEIELRQENYKLCKEINDLKNVNQSMEIIYKQAYLAGQEMEKAARELLKHLEAK